MDSIFVFDMSDMIVIILLAITVIYIIFMITFWWVKHMWCHIKGKFRGYYVRVIESGYNTGYGYAHRYDVQYKFKWKDNWITYKGDLLKVFTLDAKKELIQKLKNKELTK